MVTVPSFLLKRLYVKGSLHNNDQGFQFCLKNSLGSGYGNALFPLVVDGKELPKENSFYMSDSTAVLSLRSAKRTLYPAMNKSLTILVKGEPLSEGPHKLKIGFLAEGIGSLSFEVTDLLSES
jgi:hypothetical protein